MYMPPNSRLILDPKDEYTHEPEASNFNESMYFNAFSLENGVGCWMRLGNRVNEGLAELSCCVYLPDGRVGFINMRPPIEHNREMNAGGMRFDVVEPFKTLTARYDGELLLLDNPLDMIDPSSAFKRYPKRPASIDLRFDGISPMHGGEIVNMDGTPITVDPETSVYRGHTEQNLVVNGSVTVDGQRFDIVNGTGYRDKSWGPRHWHSFFWYKWLPVTFDRDFGILLSIKGDPAGGPNRISGNVLTDGRYDPVIAGEIVPDYADGYIVRGLTATVRTASRSYTMTAEVITTIPLRHRRVGGEGFTRITESMSRYKCEGREALGMTEFCDVMENGVPMSERAGAR